MDFKRKLLFLSDDAKFAYKYGYLDIDGNLTETGKALLLQILFENDDELSSRFFDEIREMESE